MEAALRHINRSRMSAQMDVGRRSDEMLSVWSNQKRKKEKKKRSSARGKRDADVTVYTATPAPLLPPPVPSASIGGVMERGYIPLTSKQRVRDSITWETGEFAGGSIRQSAQSLRPSSPSWRETPVRCRRRATG